MAKKSSGRVNIPWRPEEIVALGEKITEKHADDGVASPLNAVAEKINFEELATLAAAAAEQHRLSLEYRGLAEMATQKRNRMLKEMVGKERLTAIFLKGLYSDVPQMMSEWGFKVDSSPQRKKKAKAEGE